MLTLVLLTTLSISSWFSLQEEKQRVMKQIDSRGSDISRFVSKSLTYSIVGYDYHTIDLLLKEITLSDEIGYAKVIDRKGKTMSQAGTLVLDSNRMKTFHQDIILDNDKLGVLILGLNTDTAMQHIDSQKYKSIQRELFITFIIAIAEFIALSFIIIRPVSIISDTLSRSKTSDDVHFIPVSTDDEFGQLAQQFNELNSQLSKANHELQNRVDFADQQLRQSIKELKAQKAELKEINEKFQLLSITDSLTGLFNRRYFEEHLDEEINLTQRHGDTVSLIILDIDHFKNINDTYGHTHGDEALIAVAEVLKNRVRKTDIVCRIGGEEFAILCKRADNQTTTELADNLRKSVQELVIPFDDYKVSVTISAGIATLTKNNFQSHAENLYRFADLALYFSKENGRNAVTHYDDIKVKQKVS